MRKEPVPPVSQPPWLWLYLGLAATRVVPNAVNSLREDWAQFDMVGTDIPEIAPLRLLLVAEAVPMVFLALGLIGVALPGLRRRWVEWRVSAAPPTGGEHDPKHQMLADVQRFVDRHARGVEIRVTAVAGGHARIYPVSWRRARILLYGGFPKLWAQQRPMAEAVILHEIAHRRQGEHLIAGLGSPFSFLVRLWAVTYLVLSVPLVVVVTAEHGWVGNPAMAQLLLDAAAPVQLLIFPVVASWMAELAADDWAARCGNPDAVRRSFLPSPGVPARRRRALSVLDHPPVRLRRTAVPATGHSRFLSLVAWPATVVPAFLVSVAVMVPVTLLTGWLASDQPGVIAFGAGVALDSASTMEILALILLLGWPLLGTWWPRMWEPGGATGTIGASGGTVTRPSAKPFLVASTFPAVIVLGGFLPAPDLPQVDQKRLVEEAHEANEHSLPPQPSVPTTSPLPSAPTTSLPPPASTTLPLPSASMSPGRDPDPDTGNRPDAMGKYTIYWNPPGEETSTRKAEIVLDGGTGTARVQSYSLGEKKMVYIDEDLSLTREQGRWWYAGSNPVARGADVRALPTFFLLGQLNDEWTIIHACTSLDTTTCHLAWGGPDGDDPEDRDRGQFDAAVCDELGRQADHLDGLALENERLADEMLLDSTREGLLEDARQSRDEARDVRQRMAGGGCS